jgi:hypothetical protein
LRSRIPAFPFDVGFVVAGPCFVDFDENGGDEAEERLVVGEDPDLDGAALEFLLDGALDRIGSAQAPAVVLRQGEGRQAFGDGVFEPRGELGRGFAIVGDELFERGLCLCQRAGVPDAAQL